MRLLRTQASRLNGVMKQNDRSQTNFARRRRDYLARAVDSHGIDDICFTCVDWTCTGRRHDFGRCDLGYAYNRSVVVRLPKTTTFSCTRWLLQIGLLLSHPYIPLWVPDKRLIHFV